MEMSIKRSFSNYDLVTRKITFLVIFRRPTWKREHVCLLYPNALISQQVFNEMADTGRSWVKLKPVGEV